MRKSQMIILAFLLSFGCTIYFSRPVQLDSKINAADPKAEAPSVKMPADMKAKTNRLIEVEIVFDGNDPKYKILGPDVDYFREYTDSPSTVRLRIIAYKDCEATVIAFCCRDNKTSSLGTTKITFGTPEPPVPPGPTVTLSVAPANIMAGQSAVLTWNTDNATSVQLNPPVTTGPPPLGGTATITPTSTTTYTLIASGPTGTVNKSVTINVSGPAPNPAPIPLEGFRVLVIQETEGKLDEKYKNILTSDEFRSYLNRKCVQGTGRKEWYVFDPNTNLNNVEAHWKTAASRPRTSLPWIIISDGKTGTEEPLPPSLDATMKLLKKYGGE